MRRLAIVAVAMVVGVCPAFASGYSWLSRFTEKSSKELAALHAELLAPRLAGVFGVPVQDLHWKDPYLDLHLVSGIVWLEPPLQDSPALAFFSGKATVSFAPACRKARQDLAYWFGKETIAEEPLTEVLFFTLRGRSLLEQLGIAAAPGPVAPLPAEAYGKSKAAFGQLGTEPLRAFLNRDGAAKGGSWLVLTAPGIRIKNSDEALMLYRNDPESEAEVGLLASGHAQIVETGPDKYTWSTLAECRLRQGPFPGPGRVEEYAINFKTGRASDSGREGAEIRFTPAPVVSSCRLMLTPRMEVQEVTGPDGMALPFLQWRYLSNDPNYDSHLLVRMPEAPSAGGPMILRVQSEGTLFEPWGAAHYIVNEDDWYPRMDGAQASRFDVAVTVPKDQVVGGAGELIEEKVTDEGHLFHFKSAKKLQSATVIYGDFDTIEGKAGETTIRLYGSHHDVRVRKKMEYVRTEIENMVKVFSTLFGPLKQSTLRIAGILGDHGRGFEELILLSQRAGFESASSSADVFRAHEVAHQWWGNIVQPMNWPEDRWLSEAFAEYAAMEYYRIRYENPKNLSERIYLEWISSIVKSPLQTVWTLKGEKHDYRASQVSPLLDGGGNVYTKGPAVLHMLRYAFKTAKGNDEAFWAFLRSFLEKHSWQQVSTADFTHDAEAALGGAMPWFWDQWLHRAEIPTVEWSQTVQAKDGKFLLTVTGEQKGNDFTLLIPVFIHFKGDRTTVRPLALKGTQGQLQLMLPEEPTSVSLNDTWEALVNLEKK